LAVPKAFTVRRDEEPTPEDIGDDEVLLKLLKARIATAAGFFEVLEFCKLNDSEAADIDFLAERGREHWMGARALIRERRDMERARRQPPRVVEAAAK
jgi:hypothetical protein